MLLTERLNPIESSLLTEERADDNGKKSLFMTGIFIQGGVKNHNSRTYPVHEIQKAVDQAIAKIALTNGLVGETDHPETLSVGLDRVSHVITKMWMAGPDGMGTLKVIPTPMGNIIRTIAECGVKLGVSSRGVGEVDDRGLVSGFEIVTIDIVANPSAPDAYPKSVFESLNTKRGHIIADLAAAAVHDPLARKYLQEEMLKAISQLKLT